MHAKGGHLPNPYRLDVAYAGGQPVGTVEKIVMDEPNPDRLGPLHYGTAVSWYALTGITRGLP